MDLTIRCVNDPHHFQKTRHRRRAFGPSRVEQSALSTVANVSWERLTISGEHMPVMTLHRSLASKVGAGK